MTSRHKNPIPTVDMVLEHNSKILLVKRKNNPYKGFLALPGGYVNDGERIEDAARREVNEETSLDIDLLNILGVYSDPSRDPRGHLISTVFVGRYPVDNNAEPSAGDDAEEIEWVALDDLHNSNIAFDHKRILFDYKVWKVSGGTFWSSKDRSDKSYEY